MSSHQLEHHAHHSSATGRTLLLALLITAGYSVVEALVGWWAGSLALLGDAGHMATDAAALGIAAFAAWLANKAPSERHSFGLVRVEFVAALVNAIFMLVVVVSISVTAIERLLAPTPVNGEAVTLVATLGFGINLGVAWLLSRGERNLNVRAALLHVMGDVLGSVAAIISGAVISVTGWTPIDPILSLFIVALILFSSLRLLREALHGLMEGVPFAVSLPEIGQAMAATEAVVSIHDLHIWSLSSNRIALSAHVVLADMADWDAVLARLRHLLCERYGIDHLTLQPEPETAVVRWLDREHGD
jgi:cobalt-zinc-cadmium efflux system protein